MAPLSFMPWRPANGLRCMACCAIASVSHGSWMSRPPFCIGITSFRNSGHASAVLHFMSRRRLRVGTIIKSEKVAQKSYQMALIAYRCHSALTTMASPLTLQIAMKPLSIVGPLDEILNQKHLPLEEVLDRHFNPQYRQRTNGHWDDREAFMMHARKLREIIASARIELLDEFRDGNRYADRHRVHITKYAGAMVVQEVYLFAEFDEKGRFVRVEETTLMLEGAESDRDIGSVK